MTIKILSNSTINRIAAGEVIERPASVVKELVENSIDAGATKIEINLECAGKNLITVRDNGFGMSKEELELAIQRHATSKLDEDDLLNINSFGFRGEALPSIGSISKFKIISKKKGSDKAYSIKIIGGEVEETRIDVANEGTLIEIRDLFYATPARLKFLRTEKTELNASVLLVKKLALAHPNIHFTLVHNGKTIIKANNYKSEDNEDNLRNRINDIIGKDFIDNSAQIAFVHRYNNFNIKVGGYSSLPTYNKATTEDQFLFINNRAVKDKILNIALKLAYRDYLEKDRHPVCVIFLELDPHFVDVNVHPTKSEVRFDNPNLIRSIFIDAIKDALNNNSYRVSNTASEKAINYMQASLDNNENQKKNNNFQKNLFAAERLRYENNNFNIRDSYKSQNPSARIDYAIANKDKNFKNEKKNDSDLLVQTAPYANIENEEQNFTSNLDNESYQDQERYWLGAAKAQLYNTYIVSQTENEVIIVDQHAAHERIGYEKIKQKIKEKGLLKQRLLIPEIVNFDDHALIDCLIDNKEKLSELALTIEKFGDNGVIISEIPHLLGEVNVTKLINDLAEHLKATGEEIALTDLIEAITETYACHYSIRAGKKLTNEEMNGLLRQMEQTPFSGQCNHGRQTYIKLSLAEIEKLFHRR